MVAAAWGVVEHRPAVVECQDRSYEFPGFRILQSVFREDHADGVGADNRVDVVGADQLDDTAVFQCDPHLGVVEVADNLFRDVLEESDALVAHS